MLKRFQKCVRPEWVMPECFRDRLVGGGVIFSAEDRTATIDGPNLEHHHLGNNLLCSTFGFQTRCRGRNMRTETRALTQASFTKRRRC